jgi:tetratricopeptide (TPR) repeat protein
MASPLPFALYNPALLSPAALLAEFIARQPLLETLLQTIRENAVGHAPQHVLLVGARGMGKTTTLWAIAHRVDRDRELSGQWQPVVFDEESRRVGDLADFWLEAIRQWEHATKDPGHRAEALLDQPTADIEDRARDSFLQMVEHSGKRALLLVDNLNDLFASIRDPEPLHRLRAQLMEDSSVMLIGGATRYFAQITDIDQPFYDFFKVYDLAPLSLTEMKQCLTALAQSRGDPAVETAIAERQGTMASLHLLTGGNPRLIKTFYRLLAEGLQGDIRTDLEHLLDEFTPYFKAIVDALPAQQQRIFDAVALHWDPVDVATVAKAIRVPSNQVSAQLRQLVKTGHIAEASGSPKRKSYLLADRFSNIHYLMRHGRAARSRFDWFVAILQLIFPDRSPADTLAKLAHDSALTGPGGIRDAHDLLQSGLNRATSDTDRRHLLQTTLRECWNSESFEQASNWFDFATAKQHLPESDIYAFCQQMPAELRQKIGLNPDDANWWWKLTEFLEDKSAWLLAEASFQKSIEINSKNAGPWNDFGNLLQAHLQKFDEAESAYLKAIEIDSQSSDPWNGLGALLKNHLSRFSEAESAYRKAIKIDPHNSNPWNGLGNLLSDHLQRFDEAESAYRKAIEIDPHNSNPWNNLGNLLSDHLQRFDEAESAYRKAIEIDPHYSYPWAGLAELLSEDPARAPEARRTAIKAIQLNPSYGFARQMFNQICHDHASDWHEVLPVIIEQSASLPKDSVLFQFVVDGCIRLAQLASPTEARKLLQSIPAAAAPFETLRDALLAHENHAHLDRLAPERRVVAIELLNRISTRSK